MYRIFQPACMHVAYIVMHVIATKHSICNYFAKKVHHFVYKSLAILLKRSEFSGYVFSKIVDLLFESVLLHLPNPLTTGLIYAYNIYYVDCLVYAYI